MEFSRVSGGKVVKLNVWDCACHTEYSEGGYFKRVRFYCLRRPVVKLCKDAVCVGVG